MSDREELLYEKKNVFKTKDGPEAEKIFDFAKEYMKWLDSSKTEREVVSSSVRILKENGFREYHFGDKIEKGDKLYFNNRMKNLFVITVGEEGVRNGIRISASHIDSPRLDFKPVPLFETDGIGYLKTHYYGGIKKYQWTTIPLALHGVITRGDGKTVDVNIGENEGDPVFCISDLLPHLSQEQNEKLVKNAITGEELNIITGTSPMIEDGEIPKENSVKLRIMELFNEKYGIKETDFISAEICAVPQGKSFDVGIDRWLIGAYGHDDRCCAYPSLRAIIDTAKESKNTNIAVFADKEETGSDGPTGMESSLLIDLIDSLSQAFGESPALVRSRSSCLSADVAAAFDPNYPSVFEKKNSALIHYGVALSKYTGSRGKYSTNDATSEFVGKIRNLLDRDGVVWQIAELGKVDLGGGGTVAKYISKNNIDTLDIGVPVLSMHAPFELISKSDLYQAYKAFYTFHMN